MPLEKPHRPRVGVPWTTASEQARQDRRRYANYLRAIREAGAEPVEISLSLEGAALERLVVSLDAVLLPGAGADVNPRRYGSPPHPAETPPDLRREHTDDVLLDHALASEKPVLAVCYGAQMLNVHLGGSLVQDIAAELDNAIAHSSSNGGREASHPVRLAGGRLAEMAGGNLARVNSSHHQAIRNPGRGLQVTARAPDGVVEAVEWTGGPGWVLGVQWHPERMPGDALAGALFRRLVSEAQAAARRR